MNKKIIIAIVSIGIFILTLYPVFFAIDLGKYGLEIDQQIKAKEEAQFSKQYITYAISRNLEALKAMFDPKVVDAKFAEKIDLVIKSIPNEIPKSIRFIGMHTNTFKGSSTINIKSEYEFSNKWLVFDMVLKKQDTGFLVLGFYVTEIPNSLEKMNKFDFRGKSIKYYAVFTASIFLLLFEIYALALCINTPIPKRKWLWLIFIFIGVGSVKFNWTNGVFYFINELPLGYTVDYIKFPIVQFSQNLFEPFIISMTFPVSALIFLYKRNRWISSSSPLKV